ncbi:MAG: thiamine phosphate synthase [bacterium]
MNHRIGRLHVLTDEDVQSRFSHVGLARLAIEGGADAIQFREKSRSVGEIVETARAIAAVCKASGVLFIVNDRADVALAVDADGVHLGRSDLPIDAARAILGGGKIIGGSASSLEEALEAQDRGADYVGFGHIYATTSKQKEGAPNGPEVLRAVCRRIAVPVIGIGGINADNLGPVMNAGAWGIAVIGAVCSQDDPAAATRDLRSRIDAAHGK